jgi:hypothetical protein|tara:strand:+ start:153 stop:569 length:417 start_codon:yes stop_codon:yes gene_type:complete
VIVAAVAAAVWSMSAPTQPPAGSATSARAQAPTTSAAAPLAPLTPATSHNQTPPRGPVARTLPSSNLPPLPMPGFAPPRPLEVIRSVYTFAAEHPEVLDYVPCFCGCENFGHGDNHDCFVASRDPEGNVVRWEPHGMG